MLKRIKKIGLPVAFGALVSLLAPAVTFARDRDRDDERREFREHERHEFREHQRPRFRVYVGPSYSYGPSFSNGYYDRWGYWHPYPSGYYDRWGYWHPYGY